MRFFPASAAKLRHALILAFVVAGLIAKSASATDLTVAAQFFPEAAPVVIEEPAGQPSSAVVRSHDGRVLGYAFSTRQVSGSVGYSGRPLDVVAAITPEGIVAGARIVAHEEPILVIGIPREALAAYVANFKGFDVTARNGLSRVSGAAARAPQGVAGATVTSTVIRDAILRSGRAVLRVRSAASDPAGKPRLDRETLRRASWPMLVSEGALRRLEVKRGEAARLLGREDPEPDKSFIDLWLAVATPPTIGESLLGQRIFESESAKIGPEDDFLLIAASGLYSFKGTQWRQSGVFERVEIVQGNKTIPLRASDHVRIDGLQAAGTPELREIGLFRIAQASGFDATAPFRLDLTLVRDPPARTPAAPVVVSLDYRIPSRYLIAPSDQQAAVMPRELSRSGARLGGSAAEEGAELMSAPLWQDIWWERRIEIAALILMLGCLAGILVFQNTFTAHGRLYWRARIAFLLVTFGFLGLIANAQLSVVNVVTFVHALLSGFRWELFLLDPLVFLLWSFVAVSMLFWGRGVFCGWLCPFGALQELLNKLARQLGVKQIEIPFGLHERLWMLKYVIFLGILAISLNSILAAFQLAEIEPFKTAITMKFMREWPFAVYAVSLLGAGLFVERFYCRYLCPLGGALAIPARMRMFEWLKRYRECGGECHICARSCTVQAIHPLGQINPNECIYCLQCQSNYFDREVCIHLKKREDRRRMWEGLPAGGTTAAVQSQGGRDAR